MRPSLAAAAVAFTAAAWVSHTALAQPQIPATFYGSVTVDGQPAAAGLEVRGFINGLDCTQAEPGERPIIRDGATAAYVLHVVHDSQRAGCARDGATVSFTIGGRVAVQTAPWKPGPLRLDLSTGSGSPIPLPSPTGTIAAAIETAVAGGTPLPSSSPLNRPTGTPPTDDVRFEGTPVSKPTAGSPDASGGGDSVVAPLLIGIGLLALAGGAAGVLLARRRTRRRGAAGDA